ncbi:hypothetical protein TVAG_081060 [Trichomonas vaginalis G3]|uniref:Uncharacterized protein n=1 Tax=Trichomonas vaginalis (strain ATCC PRA-98 / G3) TaxID=412133 RepID=A2EPC9_TRIV3|nr:hypothetical protein TVAGG3_0679860 [Trichomonas vaginalis G3]EAY05514.1 hypothetical protein TVAG_081060 [Trichomonas vaginalis G3]KAI5507826.1 hypothetical protein TVAGG3_0679860 [Trichomonas vaginalis G3]|eukprot:XP_001317737.1 hypothetical protein [Trichomonas vaginalis G3]
MLWILVLQSKSFRVDECIDYNKSSDIHEIFNNYHNYEIKKNEQMCFIGDFIFSSDKEFQAKTILIAARGYNGESKSTEWIKDPVAVTGGCYNDKNGVELCYNARTNIQCLQDKCNFTVIKINVQPRNISFKGIINNVAGYDFKDIDMVTIGTKEKGSMELYTFSNLRRYKDGHLTGVSFRHYGIVVQNGKPEFKATNTSKARSWLMGEDGNSCRFTTSGTSSDVFLHVDYFKGVDTEKTRKLYLKEFQITLNPEGGLYTKDSPSYEFPRFKKPLEPIIIVLIVGIILGIFGIIGCVVCCVFCPCCCCNAFCVNCMPCCPINSANKEAAPEV